jgi:catechol-2,3-dioxygenase
VTATHIGRVLDGRITRPAKFAHIVLRVRQFDAVIDWYCTVLGARVVHKNAALAFLTYDDEHHRLAIVNNPMGAPVDPGACGLEHFAFTYRTLGDLLETYVRLRAEGIEPYWCINHGPTTSMYYRDPDGNQIELQVDNFESEAELMAFIRSGSFQANPIGVNFDPERLVKRYLDGDPIAELLTQGAA